MSFDLLDVENAMNLIKEEVIQELSDSVRKQAEIDRMNSGRVTNLSFYEND